MSEQDSKTDRPARLSPAYARSLELWPDPFDASEVPPPGILHAWKQGGIRDADLSAQIGGSVDCGRALLVAELLEPESPEDDAGVLPALRPEGPAQNPKPGELWTTRRAVEAFVDGVPHCRRWTFSPVSVLLLNGPHAAANDRVWRAIAVSSLWPEDERNASDIPVEAAGATFIAHRWLEYPVSESQLHACIGIVSGETLASLEKAEPVMPEESVEIARLLARCAFLPATADARRLLLDWQAEQAELLGLAYEPVASGERQPAVGRRIFHTTRRIETAVSEVVAAHLPLAARTPGSMTSVALVLRGHLRSFTREDIASQLDQACPSASSNILLEPSEKTAFAGPAFAQWDVSALHLPAQMPTLLFVVLSPTRREILATGHVRNGIATAVDCDWEACQPVIERWEEWVLLVFAPPVA